MTLPQPAALTFLSMLLVIAAAAPTCDCEARQPSVGRPPVVLLYHDDSSVRIRTIEALAARRDPSLIDDLIRAHSVENYTPVQNVYDSALRAMTDETARRSKGAWKAWLTKQADEGSLTIDYLPVNVDTLPASQRHHIQPWATELGPEHFELATAALTTAGHDAKERDAALRYLVANDRRDDVQSFLRGDWLHQLLALDDLQPNVINLVAYYLNGLADPGPLRDRINAQVRECLDAENPKLVSNTLHLLAGVEGYSTVFDVPDVAGHVRQLLDSAVPEVASQAHRAMARIDPSWVASKVSYQEAFADLYNVLGQAYPCFELKGIDWKAVGNEFLPRAEQVETDEQFGLLCLELVARLEDSHAYVAKGSAALPQVVFPRWDPGLACLIDDRDKPVVYYVDPGGPAEVAGVRVGMTVLSINGTPAAEAIQRTMDRSCKYVGYSSRRYLGYQAARWFVRQSERGAKVSIETETPDGEKQTFDLVATKDVRYLPRLPVPVPGVSDSANVSWKMLDDNVGYVYVRRIRNDLIPRLDQAIGGLKDARGLIVDVRGNSGGGFDAARSHRNFDPEDQEEPERPRFKGQIALLIDARCISAGEGWASWFLANGRARVFGETTAGASSRKRTYTLKNGMYRVTFPVKAYRGFLDRPIERSGLEPDVPQRQNARHLAEGRDTVLEAAKRYLLDGK
jgi:C-terminal processing protease CtpA/Prc